MSSLRDDAMTWSNVGNENVQAQNDYIEPGLDKGKAYELFYEDKCAAAPYKDIASYMKPHSEARSVSGHDESIPTQNSSSLKSRVHKEEFKKSDSKVDSSRSTAAFNDLPPLPSSVSRDSSWQFKKPSAKSPSSFPKNRKPTKTHNGDFCGFAHSTNKAAKEQEYYTSPPPPPPQSIYDDIGQVPGGYTRVRERIPFQRAPPREDPSSRVYHRVKDHSDFNGVVYNQPLYDDDHMSDPDVGPPAQIHFVDANGDSLEEKQNLEDGAAIDDKLYNHQDSRVSAIANADNEAINTLNAPTARPANPPLPKNTKDESSQTKDCIDSKDNNEPKLHRSHKSKTNALRKSKAHSSTRNRSKESNSSNNHGSSSFNLDMPAAVAVAEEEEEAGGSEQLDMLDRMQRTSLSASASTEDASSGAKKVHSTGEERKVNTVEQSWAICPYCHHGFAHPALPIVAESAGIQNGKPPIHVSSLVQRQGELAPVHKSKPLN